MNWVIDMCDTLVPHQQPKIMKMIRQTVSWFKSMYAPPSAAKMALRELESSMLSLMSAQSDRDYSAAMCGYYEIKINRLTAYIRRSTDVKEGN